jgi:hypothetical protein
VEVVTVTASVRDQRGRVVRNLEIRTRKKNLIVHARSGYTAGPSRSS